MDGKIFLLVIDGCVMVDSEYLLDLNSYFYLRKWSAAIRALDVLVWLTVLVTTNYMNLLANCIAGTMTNGCS